MNATRDRTAMHSLYGVRNTTYGLAKQIGKKEEYTYGVGPITYYWCATTLDVP